MEVKQAVEIAKNHILDLFANEGLSNLGLEEVEFDDVSGVWNVTVGFSRPWDKLSGAFAAIAQAANPTRSYKVVKINDDSGRVLSVKNRESKS